MALFNKKSAAPQQKSAPQGALFLLEAEGFGRAKEGGDAQHGEHRAYGLERHDDGAPLHVAGDQVHARHEIHRPQLSGRAYAGKGELFKHGVRV